MVICLRVDVSNGPDVESLDFADDWRRRSGGSDGPSPFDIVLKLQHHWSGLDEREVVLERRRVSLSGPDKDNNA
jgi:hypothetical protein